jgi:hypothetical protein
VLNPQQTRIVAVVDGKRMVTGFTKIFAGTALFTFLNGFNA